MMEGFKLMSFADDEKDSKPWHSILTDSRYRRYIYIALALILVLLIIGITVVAATATPLADYIPQRVHADLIPNTVHYTMLMKNNTAPLHFSFQSMLSAYSAMRFIKPTRIYIHTDYNDTMIDEAKRKGSKWTRMMLNNFTDIIEINRVEVPTHLQGHKIDNVEAKSDIVRWRQLHKLGGLYMDWDVLPLRDPRILREVGFRNIVGRQAGGAVNTGVAMSAKGSALSYLMSHDQFQVFDGGWETHSILLLTQISERLVRSPGEVLILDRNAMAPMDWEQKDVERLFKPHNDTKVPLFPQLNVAEEDPLARWKDKTKSVDWEIDWSSTYFLHAFRSRTFTPEGYVGVSPKYVLNRNSNYALAAWPAVQMGVEEGIFKEDDDEI